MYKHCHFRAGSSRSFHECEGWALVPKRPRFAAGWSTRSHGRGPPSRRPPAATWSPDDDTEVAPPDDAAAALSPAASRSTSASFATSSTTSATVSTNTIAAAANVMANSAAAAAPSAAATSRSRRACSRSAGALKQQSLFSSNQTTRSPSPACAAVSRTGTTNGVKQSGHGVRISAGSAGGGGAGSPPQSPRANALRRERIHATMHGRQKACQHFTTAQGSVIASFEQRQIGQRSPSGQSVRRRRHDAAS